MLEKKQLLKIMHFERLNCMECERKSVTAHETSEQNYDQIDSNGFMKENKQQHFEAIYAFCLMAGDGGGQGVLKLSLPDGMYAENATGTRNELQIKKCERNARSQRARIIAI